MQRDTWLTLRKIPYGETRSYGWVAKEIGRPGMALVQLDFPAARAEPLAHRGARQPCAHDDGLSFGLECL